jgi:hypothetical protein
MTCGKLTIDNSVLTCVHVLSNKAKYEYIKEGQEKNACESFTCSNCLDLNEYDPDQAMKSMRVVCRECFVNSRVSDKK